MGLRMRFLLKDRRPDGRRFLVVLAVMATACTAALYVWSGTLVRAAIVGLAVSVTFAVVTMILTGLVLVEMPADYFSEHRPRAFWPDRHFVIRWIGRGAKNLLGVSLVVAGIIMAIPGVPGPGVLIFVLGVMLLDFPGKRRLERWLIGRPVVLDAINRLRRRYHKAPVLMEPARPGDHHSR